MVVVEPRVRAGFARRKRIERGSGASAYPEFYTDSGKCPGKPKIDQRML